MAGKRKGLDDILDEYDISDIVEGLLPVAPKTRYLGLILRLPTHVLDVTDVESRSSNDRLIHVIREFLISEPKPTWRVIINALKHRLLNYNRLANQLEATHSPSQVMSDERAKQIISHALKAGALKQRNVVGVITGLMGSGKTTLLDRLFFREIPELYTSTGLCEASMRGLLHHIGRISAGRWNPLSYNDIRKLLAPYIKAGMNEADIKRLAISIMQLLDPSFLNSESLESVVPLEDESPAARDMLPLVQSADESKIELLELVHLIDTGGQPEVMQVMPSLIHNANIAIVMVNLVYGLDEHPIMSYHEEGVGYERQQPSRFSGRDIVLQLASTLQAKKSSSGADSDFRILVVATHRDEVKGDVDAQVEKLHQDLKSILLPAFQNELVVYDWNKIPFVMNLKILGDSDQKQLELIRAKIGGPDLGTILDVPSSFFMFEQDLLTRAEDVGRDILSLNECRQVGTRLDMSDEVVQAALILFHQQNTFLYFRQVLPNHVFVKPQVPLDIINDVVRFSYKVIKGEVKGLQAKFVIQIKEGIVTEELLSCDTISHHFTKGFYEVSDAIKLFCSTFTLAPLEADEAEERKAPIEKKKKKYLMMCLKPAIPEEELQQHIPNVADLVPLVFKFSCGCIPLGVFGSTISCLLTKYYLEVTKNDGTPKCLAHNIVTLYDPDLVVDIVLLDCIQHLEVHINSDLSSRPSPANICNQIRRKVFGAIEKVFKAMQLNQCQIKVSPAIICSCTTVRHYATFKNNLLRCSKSTILTPDAKQLMWMGEYTSSQPDLPELLRLEIQEKVGAKNYLCFGTLLLNDKTGDVIENFETECHFQIERIVIKILRRWLRSKPTPVTWGNLKNILTKCNLNALADTIDHTT